MLRTWVWASVARGDALLEELLDVGQGFSLFVGRYELVAIALALWLLRVIERFGAQARAVEVQVRIEVLGASGVDPKCSERFREFVEER